jgi:hypothetical protein
MQRQPEAELAQILSDLNKSFGENRKLVLLAEAKADPKLAEQYQHNARQLGAWIQARYATDEAPFNVQRLRQAVAMLHKSDPNTLKWMPGKKPLPLNPDGAVMVNDDAPKGGVQNTQADLIQRQEADRKAKVDATTLANTKAMCSNYDCTPHSLRFDRRKKLLTIFDQLSQVPNTTPEAIAKGVSAAILEMEKVAATGPRVRGIF